MTRERPRHRVKGLTFLWGRAHSIGSRAPLDPAAVEEGTDRAAALNASEIRRKLIGARHRIVRAVRRPKPLPEPSGQEHDKGPYYRGDDIA